MVSVKLSFKTAKVIQLLKKDKKYFTVANSTFCNCFLGSTIKTKSVFVKVQLEKCVRLDTKVVSSF